MIQKTMLFAFMAFSVFACGNSSTGPVIEIEQRLTSSSYNSDGDIVIRDGQHRKVLMRFNLKAYTRDEPRRLRLVVIGIGGQKKKIYPCMSMFPMAFFVLTTPKGIS